MSDLELEYRLRSLSRFEHSDASIGDEAADEIERLRAICRSAIAALQRGETTANVMHQLEAWKANG